MPTRVEVELDIFSGMPNPTWVLVGPDAQNFATRLAGLTRVSAQEVSGNLGYRGFIVRIVSSDQTRHIRVQTGTVHVSEGTGTICAKDENRELEGWLLNSGKPHLTNEIVEIVERNLH